MTTVEPTPAFGAIETQLRTLCLREFPCGLGSWREPEPGVKQKKKRILRRGQLKPVKCVTEKELKSDTSDLKAIKILAQKEKSEALQELVSSHFSPWHLDYSWSEEAKELREISVKSPWLIDDNFVLNYFKTLRIMDRNVTEVDNKILRLKHLEELTLSANYITNVNSKNLPQSLKVLELCANRISDISALCVRPPLLHHLGLGHNKISFIGDYITGDYWPNLLSLDLSHNDLCDLLDVIRKMGTLPKLRNLIMQGNPLSLIPGYRGYTIDSLKRLSIMDDIHISADEKHHFKGLSRRREFILDEAKVQLGITYIKGLPCPEEIKNPDSQPEYPVVERTYFIQFMFPEDRGVRALEEPLEVLHDLADLTALDEDGGITDRQEQESDRQTELQRISSGKTGDDQSQSQGQVERNVLFDSQPQFKSADVYSSGPPESIAGSKASFPRPNRNTATTDSKPDTEVQTINLDLLEDVPEQEGEDGKTDQSSAVEPTPRVKLVPVNSEPQKWAEELELNWTLDLVRDDLLALRDFFKDGMDFTVVEQVVLGYPADNETSSEKTTEGTKDGKDKKKGKGKSKEKEKPKPGKKEADAGKGKDKGKKKKEPEVELIRSPPTYTTIAAFHITLDTFLEGEFEYRNIFTKGDVPPPSTIRSTDSEDKKGDKGKDKKKASPPKSPTDKKKDNKKSPRGNKDDKKGGKGKYGAEEAEEDDLPPPPLELEVTVKLHHWVTAIDSLKEEEEKKQQNQANLGGKEIQGSKENLKH